MKSPLPPGPAHCPEAPQLKGATTAPGRGGGGNDPELRTIRLPVEMWAALDRLAVAQRHSAGWMLRALVWQHVLGRHGEPVDARSTYSGKRKPEGTQK